MQQIKSLGVLQTSKVLGALYFILGFLFAVAVMILSATTGKGRGHAGVFFLVGAPIFYGSIGFVLTAIMCALYNAIARAIGGIELELGSVMTDSAPMGSSSDLE